MNKLSSLLLIFIAFSTFATDNSRFNLDHFRANYHNYKIGDTAPDILFTRDYNITAWQIRHLPAPPTGDFWSYMDGTYVLLARNNHKIIKAMSSDTFYLKLND